MRLLLELLLLLLLLGLPLRGGRRDHELLLGLLLLADFLGRVQPVGMLRHYC